MPEGPLVRLTANDIIDGVVLIGSQFSEPMRVIGLAELEAQELHQLRRRRDLRLNELARQWFGFRPNEMPDLERLFRRVRPLEEFIELCTHQGRKRVTVSGQLIEAVSYQVPGPDLLMLIAMRDIERPDTLARCLGPESPPGGAVGPEGGGRGVPSRRRPTGAPE